MTTNKTTNKIKTITSVLLALVIAISMAAVAPLGAGALGNKFSDASAYTLGTVRRGNLRVGAAHSYRIYLPKSGRLSLECSTTAEYGVKAYMIPQDESTRIPVCSVSKKGHLRKELLGGYYCLVIENEYQYNNKIADYSFKATFTPARESFSSTFDKNDNSFSAARSIQTGVEYYGHRSEFDREDYYTFTLPVKTTVKIHSWINPTGELKLYKANLERIDDHFLVMPEQSYSYTLPAGKYYLYYNPYNDGEYHFIITASYTVTKLSLNRGTLGLGVGESYGLVKTVNPAGVPTVWSSSNTAVATVDKNGKVTGKKAGTATVTLTAGNKKASCTVTVKSAPASIRINPASLKLGVGEKYTVSECTNSGSYANAANLRWTSSNTSVAAITKQQGTNKAVITAKKAGSTDITIKTYNGKRYTCKLTVYAAPSSVRLSHTSLTLKKGQSYTISESSPSGSYANAANLRWTSSNNKVATVTKNGGNKATVKAVNKGTATVKITLFNGKTASCKVTVK